MCTLAVDFGITFTAVPSTVFVADDGSVLVGEAADQTVQGNRRPA
ncbi:MAG TPA: hypothetical protein VIC62_20275 [Nakamurella sp.]|jgi:hypothetical protein